MKTSAQRTARALRRAKATAIRCSHCGRTATRRCDAAVGKGSCNAPLCPKCATNSGPDLDLCPAHAVPRAEASAP